MQHCCATIRGHGFCFVRCSFRAKIQRNGKWYCKRHDPVARENYIKQRDAKWEAKWAAEEAAEKRRLAIEKAQQRVIAKAIRFVNTRTEIPKDIETLGLRSAVEKLRYITDTSPGGIIGENGDGKQD